MTTSDISMQSLREFAGSAEKVMRVPAFKGRLGGEDYFIITLTLGEVPRYIIGTDPSLPARQRQNRAASPKRFKEIADYMIKNRNDYRFSAITCTYGKDGDPEPFNWDPVDRDAPQGSPGWMIGMLTLDQQDPFIIVDGQHRLGAIEEAIKRDPDLRNDSIAVVLFPYTGLQECQQLFSDLNRTARLPTRSLNILFDYRDVTNRVVQEVVNRVSVFKDLVNLELATVAKSTTEMFTLASIYQASAPMIKAAPVGNIIDKKLEDEAKAGKGNERKYIEFLVDAWEFIAQQFPEWGKVARKEMNIAQHRQDFLHWNSGVVSSIGEFVGVVMRGKGTDWKETLKTALSHPDNGNWRRNISQWQGIVTAGQQVLPYSTVRHQLIAYLKVKSELSLTKNEEKTLKSLDPEIQRKIGYLK
ncbi:hypothetical protein ES703_03041 [subsurface metagenome]